MKRQRRILVLPGKESWIKNVEQNPPRIEGFSILRLEYILHLILSHKQKKHPGSWSKLNMQTMLEQIPRANKYMDFLYEEGIIDRKNHSTGQKGTKPHSKLYRIHDEDRTEYRIFSDQYIIRRIEKSMKKIRRRCSRKYPFLNEAIRNTKIDRAAAIAAIEDEYFQNVLELDKYRETLQEYIDKRISRKKKRRYPKESDITYKDILIDFENRRTFLLAEVERIHQGDPYIKRNKTNFRLDHPFTRLPSYLFKYLTIDGRPLNELDLKNSQPFFAACLFKPTPAVKKITSEYIGDYYTIFPESRKLHEKEDVKLYTSLVCEGKFYEFIMNHCRDRGITFINKGEFKDEIFTVFFGKGIAYKYNEVAEVFREKFPNVYRLFYEIKKKDHARLPNLLTRIESYVMLDRVATRIHKKYPEMPILTKHDSVQPSKCALYYTEGKSTTYDIGVIMSNTIKSETGLRPKIVMRRFI